MSVHGPITSQEDFNQRVDYLHGWLIARRGELACLVPLGALLVAGYQDGAISPVVVALCLVGEMATALWFNPYGVLNNCLSPMSRSMLLAAIILALLGTTMAVMDAPLVALLLIVLAAGCVAVGIWRRKPWLLSWQVQQSPEVDAVLAHQAHGGDFAPAAAWEQDGCRQVRALLHQALGMSCNEDELGRAYKAVYELAYLRGMERQSTTVQRLEKQLEAAQSAASKWQDKAITWQAQAKYNQDAGDSATHLRQQLEDAVQRAQSAEQRAEDAEAELAAWMPAQATESREDAIRAYLNEGHSIRDAAAAFGVSKSQVGRIARGESI